MTEPKRQPINMTGPVTTDAVEVPPVHRVKAQQKPDPPAIAELEAENNELMMLNSKLADDVERLTAAYEKLEAAHESELIVAKEVAKANYEGLKLSHKAAIQALIAEMESFNPEINDGMRGEIWQTLKKKWLR